MNPICIVDDQPFICSSVAGILKDEGYQTIVFQDAESFWQKLDSIEPSLVMLDIWLPGIDGLQLLKRLHGRFPALPIIMMSGHAGIDTAVAAIKAGAYDFMEKPLHLEVLLDKVWGLEYPGGTRTVDQHVAQVRAKLGRPDAIETVRGMGYKAVAP